METPIFDFVQQYQQEEVARFHMPGHKGQAILGCEPFDITEITGADNLQHPEAGGVIAQSEQNATALFGTAQTCYSAGGSSACISAMLYLAKIAAPAGCKERILAGRNAHKVFIQACALLDVQPSWIYPTVQAAQGICGCEITPAALEKTLAAQQAQKSLPMAVYITSPDYLGNVADVAGLAAVCKGYHLPLLVDNAHGAYLKFLQPSQHPIELGAALCCDSAHKTLPVLTGGAYLHLANANADAKAALSMFSSTSPSYLILQSLDLCNAYLAGEYRAALADCIAQVNALKATLAAHGYCVCVTEPLKLVLDCSTLQFIGGEGAHKQSMQGGEALAAYLHAQKIEVEFADPDFLVCMFTPQNTAQAFAALQAALLACLPVQRGQNAHFAATEIPSSAAAPLVAQMPDFTVPKLQVSPHAIACTLREAVFSTGEEIPVEYAVGRTCRMASVACPPAIPIVVGGEVITQNDVALFQYYGIETMNVLIEGKAPLL